MGTEKGRLVVRKKGKNKPPTIQVLAGKTTFNVAQGEVSQTILDELEQMDGQDVEFERVGGQPKKVRKAGGEFVPPAGGSASGAQCGVRGSRDRGPQRDRSARQESTRRSPDFHNPYNFVPALPRETGDPELGDREPVTQDRFHPDRYTGRIRVRMTAVTPLLVPDPEHASEDETGHKKLPLLLDAEGRPLVPASSIRGMLRAAYEVVTNSRFGRFSAEHRKRLAYRMEARAGLELIPARIHNARIHLLTGTANIGGDCRPDGPMYAAWLPRYDKNPERKSTGRAVKYPDGALPEHGDEVTCRVELVQHWGWHRKSGKHVPDFKYWRVVSIATTEEELPGGSEPAGVPPRRDRQSWHQPLGETRTIHGWVCVTNANIDRKHDERVFFQDRSLTPDGPFPVTREMKNQWRELIENCQQIHRDELAKRRKRGQRCDEYLGREPGKTAWSRHVCCEDTKELRDGTLCYVRLNKSRQSVEALFPVMIARELYPASPWELLPDSLKPATQLSELSPADRVFGWVAGEAPGSGEQSGAIAVRGLLRVGPVTCETPAEQAVERFGGDGLPLAILAAPKPQQARFYVAADKNADVQPDGLEKARAGYARDKGLRGRKVYPHHRNLPAGHWNDPLEDRTQRRSGSWQEYRRPRKRNGDTGRWEEQRDDQNRSILGWVKPGTEFTFELYVLNLSKVELGALLWLLELPQDHFHRFGGGKPLGFGSVRLEIEDRELWSGQALVERYRCWVPPAARDDPAGEAVRAFQEAIVRAYGKGQGRFEDVAFIKAFLAACRGFPGGLPVHYPRATPNGRPGPPSPQGESFKWFAANEREGYRYCLPDLARDHGLPTLPEKSGRR